MSQIHYMVGDNGQDFSFLIGYGTAFPKRPHHRGRYVNSIIKELRYILSDASPLKANFLNVHLQSIFGILVQANDVVYYLDIHSFFFNFLLLKCNKKNATATYIETNYILYFNLVLNVRMVYVLD